jgi:glucose/arabinose dehydrogenase
MIIRKILLATTLVLSIALFSCGQTVQTFSEILEIEEMPDINDIRDESMFEEEDSIEAELFFLRPRDAENSFWVKEAFEDIVFTRPLDIQNAGDGSGRIFVVEQRGRIFSIDKNLPESAQLFLNIEDRVNDGASEMGLLGLAFHPDFIENGYFYLNYTDNEGTVISRYSVSRENPNQADAESEFVIMKFNQPYTNHNGGQIAFGPDDGYLYIATGDGGSSGDPQNNSQNLKTLLGKILRIDIDNQDEGFNYSIPPDNPFADNTEGYRQEIYAYGLRNPWRFSFDPKTGTLWAADVGQNKIEEINIIEKGKNYGWNIMEGSTCFNPPTGCDTSGLELPIYEYEHPIGRSVTGGYVYRGAKLPIIYGAYLYADYVTGIIWGLWYEETQEIENYILVETGLMISSFGVDEENELYLSAFDGKIYHLSILP